MSKRLLITDDALIIREMIKDAAQQEGWEIAAEATNGQEAIEQYRACRPDAMTLDMVMPEYDGIYALQGILQEDPNANVLVVSALDQQQVLHQALQLGAREFIFKPFDAVRLVDALENLAAAI